jgi:hypothetical protein
MLVFSDMDDFLWLRVRAERSCEDFVPASAGRAMRECLARLKKYAGYTTTNSAPI